jgi:hypothetical protein
MQLAVVIEKLPSRTAFLLAFATFLLVLALMIAWGLGVTLFFPHGDLASRIVERSDLIKAHIDFLMMAQFLFLFALLLRQYAIVPPYWAIFASCWGAFFNPLAFAARAFKPKPDPAALPIDPHFPLQAAISFTCVTVGFLTLAGLAAHAAWRANRAAR